MDNKFLILTILAFAILVYYRDNIPEHYFSAAVVAVVFLFVMSTRETETVEEGFVEGDDDSQGRVVRYGDVITLWTWTNQFLRASSRNVIDGSPRLSKPEDIPRVGWDWEFFVIEDPRELAFGVNNNRNPVKYGDKIMLRTWKPRFFVSIPNRASNNKVRMSRKRDQWAQFQFVSTVKSGIGGVDVRYGDQLYIKTLRNNPVTYIEVDDGGRASQTSEQGSQAMFRIFDRFGQGNSIDWARRGSASQSSNYGNYPPNNAIDGNFLTFNHTQADNNSWWKVDLPRDIYINKVVIKNRHDCCQNRLTDFDVFVLDRNGNSVTSKHYTTAGNGVTWSNINRIGRSVKIQLRKKNYLHMGEVNVLGSPVNYSLLLEKPLSTDVLNEPRTFVTKKDISDPTNSLVVFSEDLPYNSRSGSSTLSLFVKLNRINSGETSIVHKGGSDNEKSPAITAIAGTTRLRFYYGTGQNTFQFIDDSENLPVKTWNHVTAIIDAGVNEKNGWQMGTFKDKLKSAPYNKCCYYINPNTRQYYYVPNNLRVSTAKNNVWDNNIIENMRFMGTLTSEMTKPGVYLYINGVLRASKTLTSPPVLNNGPLSIGNSPNLSLRSADVTVDQIKYFNFKIPHELILMLAKFPLNNITKTLVDGEMNAMNIKTFQPNQMPHIEKDFTVNFWMYSIRPINGTGNWDKVFFKGIISTDRAPAMWFIPKGNQLHMPIRTRNKSYKWGEGIKRSGFKVDINQWNHIALTIKDKVQTLYVNGKKNNQVTLSDYPVYIFSPMSVGGFTGKIRNFQVSNFAMTPAQIKIAMGVHPDEPVNKVIRKMWEDAGCLTNPVPDSDPNAHANWKTFIRNDQKSRVEGIIRDIKKRADKGDKKMQEMCYGKFTAGMLNKLSEKDKILQYTLDKQRSGKHCLPMAPFECQNKTINDFDIRTHKDFHKYTLSTRIQKCDVKPKTAGDFNITDHPDYAKLKAELDSTKLMVTKLETLKNALEAQVKELSAKSQLTEEQVKQHPAFVGLKDNLDAINKQLDQHKNAAQDLQGKLDTVDVTKTPEYMKLFAENERNRKLAQANLVNNLDLSQLQNNPLFLQILRDIQKDSAKPQQCSSSDPKFAQKMNEASRLSKQAVAELEKTKKLAAEILANLKSLNLDDATIQKLLSGDTSDPEFQQLLQRIKSTQIDPSKYRIEDHPEYNKFADQMKKTGCSNIPIEQHPQYNELAKKLRGDVNGNGMPKNVRCWGCNLPDDEEGFMYRR